MADTPQHDITIRENEITPLFARALLAVREDMRDNPYILEGLKVLQVGGYRSAIGAFWNAVVDDLRNKVTSRSLKLFNKVIKAQREIKCYEDFQDHVNDDQLIDGAYEIGVISWEARKMLRHAKEVRHVFSGHPKSTEPSAFKVLAMMDDCIKYVLNAEYPPQIIDIDDYIGALGREDFARNDVAVENALSDLPEVYKTELINRLFTCYVHESSTSVLRSNVEFSAPFLWHVLPKDTKIQVVRRVDQEITKGIAPIIEQAFAFVRIVDATAYLSTTARKYRLAPIVAQLKDSLDHWSQEDRLVQALEPYAGVIPADLITDYVWALTHTYVGRIGSSAQFSRTDFYANSAALYIPRMFQAFDDRAAEAFVQVVRTSEVLRQRIRTPVKLRRLRSLASIVLERVSATFKELTFLLALSDEACEEEFFRQLPLTPGA